MGQIRDHDRAEHLFDEQVGMNLAHGETTAGVCEELARVLKIVGSHHFTEALRAVPVDFQRCRNDLGHALDRLTNLPREKTRVRLPTGHSIRKKKGALLMIFDLKAELARSRMRLIEREGQVVALIDEGLCLAFEKETLQKKVIELSRWRY